MVRNIHVPIGDYLSVDWQILKSSPSTFGALPGHNEIAGARGRCFLFVGVKVLKLTHSRAFYNDL